MKKIKLFFTNNLNIKIISIILAILLWFHVVTERVYDRIITLPLICKNFPQSYIFIKEPPKEVKVRLVGKGKEFISLRKPKIEIDMSNIELGWHKYDLTEKKFKINYSGKFDYVEVIEPKNFVILVEKMVKKKLKVIPNLSSNKYSYKVIPDEIELIGGDALRSINYITTKKIENNKSTPCTLKVALNIPEGIKSSIDSVIVILE